MDDNRDIDEICNVDDCVQTDNQIDLVQKAELIQFNNGWNDKNEKLIISIGENSAAYKWMHERCSNYNKRIYNITSIFLIILSSTLSAETFIPDKNSNLGLSITKQIIVYLITVISILQNFLKSEEFAEKHSTAAGEFSKLYHDIQQQMCRFRRDRYDASKYVSNCLTKYDSLIITHPDINKWVISNFKRTFKNSNISVPDITDNINKIEIITEQSHITQNNIKSIINTKTLHSNNLVEIHNAFQIHGDISDKDLENADVKELKRLKESFLQNKSKYEYERYLQHSLETD